MSKRKHKSYVVIDGNGEPCPRCGGPTQIREHEQVTARQLRQPYYYSRWYYCVDQHCPTTMIMPEAFKVWNAPEVTELALVVARLSPRDQDFSRSLIEDASRGPLSPKQRQWADYLRRRALGMLVATAS
jgi:hypothetical protein